MQIAVKMAEMGVKLLGGCCGTNPGFIGELRSRLHKRKWKKPDNPIITAVASSRQTVLFDSRIRIVGNRINPACLQHMTESLQNGDLNFLYVEALVQKEAGADLVDINVCTVGVNEAEAMRDAVGLIQSMVPVPMQLSSQNCEALEAGARVINGKPLLNSVDGTNNPWIRSFLSQPNIACLIGKLPMIMEFLRVPKKGWL